MPVNHDELLETVAVHVNWLRRTDDQLQNRADALQSADYLERLAAALRAALAAQPSYPDEEETRAAMDREAAAGSATPTERGWMDDAPDDVKRQAIEDGNPAAVAGSATPTGDNE